MAESITKRYENQLPSKESLISGDYIRVIGNDNKCYKISVDTLKSYIVNDVDAGLSAAARTALLNCFANVVWANTSGQSYYNALANALR